MYKVVSEFYCHTIGRTLHVGERISDQIYLNLSDAEKENLVDEYEDVAVLVNEAGLSPEAAADAVANVDQMPDEITVTADEQLLEMNPQLVEEGVKVGDEVTFGGIVDAPETDSGSTIPEYLVGADPSAELSEETGPLAD